MFQLLNALFIFYCTISFNITKIIRNFFYRVFQNLNKITLKVMMIKKK